MGIRLEAFKEALERHKPHKDSCLFVCMPDVVGDAEKTRDLYEEHFGWISEYGYPVAFVAQDGQEGMCFPPEFDVLFIGGSDRFKDSWRGVNCAKRAKAIGKRIHVGRVNGLRRIKNWYGFGDTCDGTHIKFERDKALNRLNEWMNVCAGNFGKQLTIREGT